MKKVILALAIVSVSFAACNNAGEETPKADTPVIESPKVDSPVIVVPDTTMAPKPDTSAPAAH